MRKKVVAGNWKMNLDRESSINLMNGILKLINVDVQVKVIISPPFTFLYELSELIRDRNNIFLSSQNINSNNSGSYTGEVSAEMVRSLGVEYTIIGHSERRQYFNENNLVIKEKVDISIKNSLNVIFCCGEDIMNRKKGTHFDWIKNQIEDSLFHLKDAEIRDLIIAYEPIWAIGTGETASPLQAEEMHKFIRSLINSKYGKEISESISILYGGSCNPDNAKDLFSMKNIDGGLIGGASLNSNSFFKIIESF